MGGLRSLERRDQASQHRDRAQQQADAPKDDRVRRTDLVQGAGEEATFGPIVTELRETQKRKRNLMKMFDREGW